MAIMEEVGEGNGSIKKRVRRKRVKVILKSGLLSTPLVPEDLDRRYGFTQAYRGRMDSLVEAVGGNPTPQEYMLIKRIAWGDTVLDNHEMAVVGGYEPTESERKWYIGLRNSNSRDIGRLGIERRMKDITPLRDRLAALAARSGNGEGNNGQG